MAVRVCVLLLCLLGSFVAAEVHNRTLKQSRPAPRDVLNSVHQELQGGDDNVMGWDEGAPTGAPTQACIDMPPPGALSCSEHKAFGDCARSIITNGNFCAATCGRCQAPLSKRAPPVGVGTAFQILPGRRPNGGDTAKQRVPVPPAASGPNSEQRPSPNAARPAPGQAAEEAITGPSSSSLQQGSDKAPQPSTALRVVPLALAPAPSNEAAVSIDIMGPLPAPYHSDPAASPESGSSSSGRFEDFPRFARTESAPQQAAIMIAPARESGSAAPTPVLLEEAGLAGLSTPAPIQEAATSPQAPSLEAGHTQPRHDALTLFTGNGLSQQSPGAELETALPSPVLAPFAEAATATLAPFSEGTLSPPARSSEWFDGLPRFTRTSSAEQISEGAAVTEVAAAAALLDLGPAQESMPQGPALELEISAGWKPRVPAAEEEFDYDWYILGAPGSENATDLAETLPTEELGVFVGDGTAYSEVVNNTGRGFACSFRYLNDWASKHFAAINAEQWDNGNACGKCAMVRCIDSRCPVQGEDYTVIIVDLCPECKHGDLDFSIPVYKDITGLWPHRMKVQWEWAACAPFINGTISMHLKDGSNPYWQAYYFSNMKYPLKSAYINGRELIRSQFQFFQHTAMLGDGPVKIELEADNGMKVVAFSDSPWAKDQDLRVQFDMLEDYFGLQLEGQEVEADEVTMKNIG